MRSYVCKTRCLFQNKKHHINQAFNEGDVLEFDGDLSIECPAESTYFRFIEPKKPRDVPPEAETETEGEGDEPDPDADESAAGEGPEDVPQEAETETQLLMDELITPENQKLEDMTREELLEYATQHGYTGLSRMKKEQILEVIATDGTYTESPTE